MNNKISQDYQDNFHCLLQLISEASLQKTCRYLLLMICSFFSCRKIRKICSFPFSLLDIFCWLMFSLHTPVPTKQTLTFYSSKQVQVLESLTVLFMFIKFDTVYFDNLITISEETLCFQHPFFSLSPSFNDFHTPFKDLISRTSVVWVLLEDFGLIINIAVSVY